MSTEERLAEIKTALEPWRWVLPGTSMTMGDVSWLFQACRDLVDLIEKQREVAEAAKSVLNALYDYELGLAPETVIARHNLAKALASLEET